jgi:myo-inositol catabolism protein IolC
MKLFILPFDHRASFLKILEEPNKKKVEELKQIIFNGFLKVYTGYKKKKELAILVDEKYGSAIIKYAKEKNITICLPIEKSGKDILELEYKDLNEVKKINPDYIKILIRYNPFNIKINEKQINILKQADIFCKKNNYKVILELLVPPTEDDLKLTRNYDKYLRLDRTCRAIDEIKESIKVDIWKLEGFTRKGFDKINKVTNSKIIFLGRGESKEKVKKWLIESKNVKNVIGFAIGRTLFLDVIKKYSKGLIDKEKASQEIADNFKYFIDLSNK